MSAAVYRDRHDAGRVLAQALRHYARQPDTTVLGLPRGGVPVAYEVALALQLPLDVFIVRKLGVPGNEELALGAVASGGERVLNDDVVRALGLTAAQVDAVAREEATELARRERLYHADGMPEAARLGTVIVVDDGLATGATMLAAVTALRRAGARRIVVAVPTAAPGTCERLRPVADAVLCAATPQPLPAVGAWYDDFSQTSDDEVRGLLAAAHAGAHARAQAAQH